MHDEVTYILLISYDGTDYYGWQKQPDKPTIQGVLEQNLFKIFNNPDIKTVGASRTDRGVHAIGQAVSFCAQPRYDPENLKWRLNKMLPHDISMINARIIHGKFNARFDALKKDYLYRISFIKKPLTMRYTWWINCLSENVFARLKQTEEYLLGSHDFSAFSIKKELPDKPVCNIFNAHWELQDSNELHFHICADRFLYKMVRSLVGAMLNFARGKFTQKELLTMLNTGNRILEYPTAPPQGLTLMKVYYSEDEK